MQWRLSLDTQLLISPWFVSENLFKLFRLQDCVINAFDQQQKYDLTNDGQLLFFVAMICKVLYNHYGLNLPKHE